MTPMDDPTPQPDRPTSSTACPWCSTSVTPETESCPSCGAVLIGDEDSVLPGVTAVDDKVRRGETRTQERSRLLSWISGEYSEEAAAVADSQAIAPPDPEVQREIRRLQLEAEIANLTAEVQARRVEAVADVIDEGDPALAEAAVAALEAAEAQDAVVAAEAQEAVAAAADAESDGTSVTVDAAARMANLTSADEPAVDDQGADDTAAEDGADETAAEAGAAHTPAEDTRPA
jgi:hypothetical protein